MARTKKSGNESYQEIVDKYRASGEKWPATARMIGAWALRHKLVEPEPKTVLDQVSSAISAAMREEYFTDEEGRRVRKLHAVREVTELQEGKYEQRVFWVDIRDAAPKDMQAAFQQRRMQILGDCRQLKTDVDSYNIHNGHHVNIQMCFNFMDDLAELEQPTEYAGLDQD
ncbi:MAG: hypothetical protein ABFE01_15475 [Phycisphaerales bacterium]